MNDPLGLSVGTTNLVAASAGHQPVIRRSVLTLFGHAGPEVGIPRKDAPAAGGMVLSGFVDRVGDPVPLVAEDGATYPAEQLLVEALESMAGLSSPAPRTSIPDVVIAVPSYWSPAMSGALQATLGASEVLNPGGVAPRVIPDAVAALTALNVNPGIDRRGTVALLDFGGGGTSITLADAASAFDVIDGTDRIPEFAGDQIDQLLLSHVLEGITGDGDVDPGQTAAVGSLAPLREQCRSAKERLSRETVTELTVDLPNHRADIRVTRDELEDLVGRQLDGVVAALEDMLARNNIGWDAVSAVALAGGGASIPLVVQRLSERSQAAVVTSAQPGLDAGVGAALLAAQLREADIATGVAPVAPAPALAWSQDDEPDDVIPYSGGDHSGADPYEGADYLSPNPYGSAEDVVATSGPESLAQDDVKPWQRLPMSALGIAGAVALVAVGGMTIALTSVDGGDREQPQPRNAPLSSAFTPSDPPAETITLNNQPAQNPPEPTAPVDPSNVAATTTPTTTAAPTTSTTSPTTTTTTTTTMTTTTTTTTPTTTTPTTTPATTQATPTTTAPATTPATSQATATTQATAANQAAPTSQATASNQATATPQTPAATPATAAPVTGAAGSDPPAPAITTPLLPIPSAAVPIPIPDGP